MQMLQITPAMGYLAVHAQGMTIGPNILILPPLNPVHVAEEAATLDVLTGGNYILGIGLGYRQPEFEAFGISLSERAARFNESIALMRRLWTEDRVSHQGRFYAVNNAGISVKPVRQGGPPLYIAGQAEVSVRLAAEGRAVTAKGADPDTLVASAKAYLGALNKLMARRHGKLAGVDAAGQRIHSTDAI